jgi:hypothetical protein
MIKVYNTGKEAKRLRHSQLGKMKREGIFLFNKCHKIKIRSFSEMKKIER